MILEAGDDFLSILRGGSNSVRLVAWVATGPASQGQTKIEEVSLEEEIRLREEEEIRLSRQAPPLMMEDFDRQ